jgi:hypothetical protein
MPDVIELVGIVSYQENPFLKKPEPHIPRLIPQNGMNFCFREIKGGGINLYIFQLSCFIV